MEDQQLAAAFAELGERRITIGVVDRRECLHPCRIAIEVELRDRERRVWRREELVGQCTGHQRRVDRIRRTRRRGAELPLTPSGSGNPRIPRLSNVERTSRMNLRDRRTSSRAPRPARTSGRSRSFAPAHCRRFGSKRHASGRSTIPSTAPSAASHAVVTPRATSARSASLNARLSTRCPCVVGWGDGEIRLRVPGRGNRRAARHAHRRCADRDAVEVRRISLREHHALPPTARTADEVLPIGGAAVIARRRSQRRSSRFVRARRTHDRRARPDRDRTRASRPGVPRPLSRRQSRAAVRCPETIPYCARLPVRRCRRCHRLPGRGTGRSTQSANEVRSASRRPCHRRPCAAPPTRARRSARAEQRIRRRRWWSASQPP